MKIIEFVEYNGIHTMEQKVLLYLTVYKTYVCYIFSKPQIKFSIPSPLRN